MNEDPEGISRRENHRAERGGDPEGISPGESQQGEALAVNAKGGSPRENQQGEALVVRWEQLLIRAGCDRSVIAHARAVTALAFLFTESPVVNRDLVRTGAMLHDIGRGVTHGVDHAQRGAALATSLGVPPPVVSIIERHIGAGMTADECSLEGLLPRDCVPRTLEEKIVANADNLVQGDRAGSIEATLEASIRLKKRIRRRIFRLWLEMESLR
ncbi:MAG TPA: HDIG domain-containing protein [Methanomicrobiales archaeon]|nr:HDIG domain-containing protein [Methanomicrobiales archaeon]